MRQPNNKIIGLPTPATLPTRVPFESTASLSDASIQRSTKRKHDSCKISSQPSFKKSSKGLFDILCKLILAGLIEIFAIFVDF